MLYISNVEKYAKRAFPTIEAVLFSFIYILHLNILITYYIIKHTRI